MTPTWAVILVGVTSGALGSLVTAVVTASHERAAEFRTRMLNAADEFSTAAIVASQQTRDTAGAVKDAKAPLVDDTGAFRSEIKTLLEAWRIRTERRWSGDRTLAQAAGMSPDLLSRLLRATAARCVRI
jgi:PleD family two-component response regulator